MKFRFVLLGMFLTSLTIIAQNIEGTWSGVLNISGREYKSVFHINKSNDAYHSTMDSPDQGAYGIEANSTNYVNSLLTIEILSAGIKYEGKLKDTQNITGMLHQGGQSYSLNLSKGNIQKEIVNRPQEPKEPYPYLTEDVKFENKKDNVQLAGTLTLPGNNGVYPAVVLISGSGKQNRDEEIFGHKPFLVLADYLTKKGFAVLRYDDRGFGESTGDASTATTFDFANDTQAAINYLKTRNEIKKTKIGLIGHSEGGVIAPILASKNSDVDFIVMLAGPAMRGDNILLGQLLKSNEIAGLPSEAVKVNQKIMRGVYDIILDEAIDSQKLADSLKNYLSVNYGAILPETEINEMGKNLTFSWMVAFLRTDPTDYLAKVNCPVLALYGSKDIQVPSKENIEILNSIKESFKKNNINIVELKNLNHLFQECKTGLPDEYGKIEQTISPMALEQISNWLLEVCESK